MSRRCLYAEWFSDGMAAFKRWLTPRMCIALAIPLFAFTTWVLVSAVSDREVVVMSNGKGVSGVTVSHLHGGTWEEAITDESGVAPIGRGPWSWPGSRKPVILLVREGEDVLWSGDPRSGYRERVTIELVSEPNS